MKIGIFDSGLGGLIVTRAIYKLLPQYDYVYLGDTKRVPYGNRSETTIFEFSKEAMNYLFKKENCVIIVIACNTVSARALRKLQKEYLMKNFPKRRVLGVLIPAAEEAINFKKVGVLATRGTVASNTFPKEIKKLTHARGQTSKKTQVFQNAAPLLVPLIEEGETRFAKPIILNYIKPLINKKIGALVLGCTHYPIFKKEIKKYVGKKVKIISQDEIIPKKLKNYLERHPEIESKITKNRKIKVLVTDKTKTVNKLTRKWFGNIKPKLIKL